MTTVAPTPARPGLLLVDDDPLITDSLSIVLGRHYEVTCADSHATALARLADMPARPALALVDLGLPPAPHAPTEGYRLIGDLIARAPGLKIVVLSGQSEAATGRHARALGAVEFIPKPARPDHLLRILGEVAAAAERESGDRQRPADDPLAALIGASPAMAALKTQIRLYADSPFPVLVEGGSGCGKALVAEALHALSGRQHRERVIWQGATLTPAALEPAAAGAPGGTLVIDEIAELPAALQAALLRSLEAAETSPDATRHPRIVAITSRDLRARAGEFRADLFHRLSVLHLRVPPLRDLGDDRALLFDHFARLYAGTGGAPSLGGEARRLWLDYPFPGNVRELRNVVIRLATRHPGRTLEVADIEPELDSGATLAARPSDGPLDAAALDELDRRGSIDLDARLAGWERAYIAAAMRRSNGNVSQAARLLGINRTTLYSRMSALERQE